MKKETSSFDVAAVVSELMQRIGDAWIVNIYQPDFKTLIFKLHQPDQPALNLLIEAGRRLHLTRYVVEKPTKPSAFCMTLRKYLRNGRIQAIQQHEFERIVTMRIKAKQEEFMLATELFGDGNIILVSQETKILQALTYKKMRDRNILRYENFQYPPPSGKNPFKIEKNDLEEIRNLGQLETVKSLVRFLGVGGFYAEEILLRAKIDKNAPCNSLKAADLDDIFDVVRDLLSMIEMGGLKPSIVIDEKGEWVDVTPFPLKKYLTLQSKSCPSFNEALDEYYSQKTTEQEATTITEDTEQLLAQQQRILGKQQKTVEEIKQEIGKNKKTGDTIYAHFSELQHLFQKITDAKSAGKSWNEIVSTVEKEKKDGIAPATYYGSFDLERAILHLCIDGSTFSVNLRKSVQENAAEYYEKSKKAQRRLEGAGKALLQTTQKIEELEKEKTEKMAAITNPVLQKVEKKVWYEKFRWFHSSEGFLVLGGKDVATNEILVKKYMASDDLVFHADIIGAPFVIIKTEGRQVPEQTIKEVAEFAAAFSRAWKEAYGAVDVYWVRPEQVSKTPPSGQFLQKGAFMIYGKKNYVRKVQLRTAIGVVAKEEGLVKVIGGPRDAVSGQTNCYVEIVLGEQASGTLAKQIRQLLFQKVPKEYQEAVLSVSLEEIQKFIPPGKGTVLQ